jgi:hypothetical protein
MRKLLFWIFTLGAMPTALAQPGELRGRVTDAATGAAMPYANVAIVSRGAVVSGTSADSTGYYRIKPLEAGAYHVRASFVTYRPAEITGVRIESGRITYLDLALDRDNDLPVVDIPAWRDPLIKKDEMTTMFSLDAGQLEHAVNPELRTLAALSPAVVQPRENGPIHVRGARPEATQWLVNGVRVREDLSLPRGCIERLEVLTGGIPASYGDATGGFIVVTTKSYLRN